MADENRGWPQKALTAAAVRNAKPGKHYDGNGLFLRVDVTGARRWVQRITVRGKQREIGLGSAALVSLAEAREWALSNRRLARAGGDPLAAKREATAIMTFEEAARAVHEAHKPTWKNAKHAAQFISTLETYAFPHFGAAKVSEVTSADVLAALGTIWIQKPETARRVRQRIGTVMSWAIAKGWRKDDPTAASAAALPKQGRRAANRKALPYEEVAGCIKAVQASKAGAVTKLALEFLVLTATRSGEVRLAAWSEVDLGAAEWAIPGERMKMKRNHRVPLSARAVEVLRAAQALGDGSGLVFPGTRRGRPLSDMTLSKLVKELGFDVDVHGFRTSFRTWAQEKTNFPREIAEAALAHAVGDAVEQAYARSDVFEKRRKMMEAWAGYLAAERGKVVRIG
jgi:integrase